MYWESDKPRKASRIIRKLSKETNPVTLSRIIEEAPLADVRLAAAEMIAPGKTSAMALLIRDFDDPAVESVLLAKIRGDEELFSYVMEHEIVAERAVKLLRDERYLREIIETSREGKRRPYPLEARKAALRKMQDPEQLRMVSQMIRLNMTDVELRREAEAKLAAMGADPEKA